MVHGSTKITVKLHGETEPKTMTVAELFETYESCIATKDPFQNIVSLRNMYVRIESIGGNGITWSRVGAINKMYLYFPHDWYLVKCGHKEIIVDNDEFFVDYSSKVTKQRIPNMTGKLYFPNWSIRVFSDDKQYTSDITVEKWNCAEDDGRVRYLIYSDGDSYIFNNIHIANTNHFSDNRECQKMGSEEYDRETNSLRLLKMELHSNTTSIQSLARIDDGNKVFHAADGYYYENNRLVSLVIDYAHILNAASGFDLETRKLNYICHASSIFYDELVDAYEKEGYEGIIFDKKLIQTRLDDTSFLLFPHSGTLSDIWDYAMWDGGTGYVVVLSAMAASKLYHDLPSEDMSLIMMSRFPILTRSLDVTRRTKDYAELIYAARALARNYISPRLDGFNDIVINKVRETDDLSLALYGGALLDFLDHPDEQTYAAYSYYKYNYEFPKKSCINL